MGRKKIEKVEPEEKKTPAKGKPKGKMVVPQVEVKEPKLKKLKGKLDRVEEPKPKKSKKKEENEANAVSKNIVKKRGKKKKRQKKSKKKEETPVAIVKQKKSKVEEVDLLDDDFNEGQSKKRKRKKREPLVETEYEFTDPVDLPNGDARNHFNTVMDDGYEFSIWCPKVESRLFPKVCGLYVTPKCQKKFKCEHFEYGSSVKARYRLKTVERTDKDESTKKKKKQAEETLEMVDETEL